MIALLDACVLYTSALRNLLMWTAAHRLYQARWTDIIHEEWIRNLLANRPDLDPVRLQRIRRLMDAIHPECLVRGYERRIPALSLPDPDDRHVLAAAMHAKASVIVTFNLTDFPIAILETAGIRATHPDAFLVDLFRENSSGFLHTVRTHRESLQKPAQTAPEYLESLRASGLEGLVTLLAMHSDKC